MSPVMQEILQAALALPESELAELTEELLAAQAHPIDSPIAPEWVPEIDRRSSEIEEGRVELIPWSEVKRRGSQLIRDGGCEHLAVG